MTAAARTALAQAQREHRDVARALFVAALFGVVCAVAGAVRGAPAPLVAVLGLSVAATFFFGISRSASARRAAPPKRSV